MPPQRNNGKKRASEYGSKQANKKFRKGAPPAADGGGVELDPIAQEKALKAYLHHAVKLLHKAVKKSKTFELQKLTRKLKTTREPKEGAPDAAAVADLDAQLVVIKSLNLDAVPTHLLTTRLPKLPALRSAPFLTSLLSSIPPAPGKASFAELDPQSAEGKARNRVLASKVVGEAWDEIVRAVKKRMGEEVDGKGKGKEKEKVEETKKGIQMDPGRAAALEAALLKGREEAEGDSGVESSDDEGPAAGFSSGEEADEADEDDEIARELARLNEGAGSDGEWSGSDDEDEGAAFSGEDDDDVASDSSFPTGRAAKSAKSASASTSTSSKKRQPSLSPSPPPAKKSKSAPVNKPITSSSFLPSLAAGYVAVSDSDDEDARWVKDAEREDKKNARKNRRGQRARQAIWEKKFGSAANHVVKSQGGKPVSLAKMKEIKAKRNGTSKRPERPDRPEKPEEPFDIKHARGGSTNPNAQSLGPKARAFGGAGVPEGEKMHPSWEAKRKQKEAQALMNSALAKPQGKKVVFD